MVSVAKACDLGQMLSCGCSPLTSNGQVCNRSISYAKTVTSLFYGLQTDSKKSAGSHSDVISAHNLNLGIKVLWT